MKNLKYDMADIEAFPKSKHIRVRIEICTLHCARAYKTSLEFPTSFLGADVVLCGLLVTKILSPK
jgi:hypothetical protein